MKFFNMGILNWENIKELDLSWNSLYFSDSYFTATNVENIQLNNVKFLNSNVSFEIFIDSKIKYLDFSNNNFSKDQFQIFDNLSNIVSFKLSKVNFKKIL